MTFMKLYNDVCNICSKTVTRKYSTSFSMGIRIFQPRFRKPIYNIYGFVRFADEIVDTFHEQDKATILEEFKKDTYLAIERKFSMNPILQSFQMTVHKYGIDLELIDAFLHSMAMDLDFSKYNDDMYEEYIYGSAEVVGLMCLKVFCEGNKEEYDKLSPMARRLGAAFQKINFLRDMKSDYEERGRVYFPKVDYSHFTKEDKLAIENDIYEDFQEGLRGIGMLPTGCKLGVYLAYVYYINLFKKIQHSPVEAVKNERIRISNRFKVYLLFKSSVKLRLNML